eukprot:g672.t1
MIELIWGRSKWFVRRTDHSHKGTLKALVGGKDGNPKGLIWTSFEKENLPFTLVWKYAAKCRDYIRLYDKEVQSGKILMARKLYKSHRRIFKTTNTGSEEDEFKGVEWKTLKVEVLDV